MTEITMNAISEENVSGSLDISGWVKAHNLRASNVVSIEVPPPGLLILPLGSRIRMLLRNF